MMTTPMPEVRERFPPIGTPLGRRQMEYNNGLIREVYRRATLIAWGGHNKDRPIVQYKDGSYEELESIAQTDWGPAHNIYRD